MGTNILKKIQIILIIASFLFIVSCKDGCNHNKFKVDVKEIPVQIDYRRFDIDLRNCRNASDIQNLEKVYKTFYYDFVYRVNGYIPTKDDSLCTGDMLKFVNDSNFISLCDSIQKVFKDDAFLKEGLTDAIKHYKYYFTKDTTIPVFIGFPSSLLFPNIFSDNYVGIGLDMYLGKSFPYYYSPRLDYPQYIIDKYIKEYAVRNTVMAFIRQHFDEEPRPLFIERAVQQGRYYYMLDALCPEMPDTIKIQYTSKKLEWMHQVEKEMWIDLINRKVLYQKNREEVDRFFSDGPFTNAANVSPDSPPRVGEWLGWQIVKKYMDSHSNITIPELMNERDLMKIFKESGYRPK